MANVKRISKKKEKLHEEVEVLETIGQDSELGAKKWVNEYVETEEKKEQGEKDLFLESLDRKTRFQFLDYKRHLAEILTRLLTETRFPNNWFFHVGITDKGLALLIWNLEGRKFVRGFSPVNLPKPDLNAVMVLVESSLDKIEEIEKEGIILA